MSYKDICINYVERRKFETEDGKWYWGDPNTGEPINDTIYETEEELDDVLWEYAIKNAWENLV